MLWVEHVNYDINSGMMDSFCEPIVITVQTIDFVAALVYTLVALVS